jgi:hypothetical protein
MRKNKKENGHILTTAVRNSNPRCIYLVHHFFCSRCRDHARRWYELSSYPACHITVLDCCSIIPELSYRNSGHLWQISSKSRRTGISKLFCRTSNASTRFTLRSKAVTLSSQIVEACNHAYYIDRRKKVDQQTLRFGELHLSFIVVF